MVPACICFLFDVGIGWSCHTTKNNLCYEINLCHDARKKSLWARNQGSLFLLLALARLFFFLVEPPSVDPAFVAFFFFFLRPPSVRASSRCGGIGSAGSSSSSGSLVSASFTRPSAWITGASAAVASVEANAFESTQRCGLGKYKPPIWHVRLIGPESRPKLVLRFILGLFCDYLDRRF